MNWRRGGGAEATVNNVDEWGLSLLTHDSANNNPFGRSEALLRAVCPTDNDLLFTAHSSRRQELNPDSLDQATFGTS